MHLLTHAWVARAVRLPAVLVVQRARLHDDSLYSPFTRRARSATGALRWRCRARTCGAAASRVVHLVC